MKSTRVCRKCRTPQLLETLEEFMEGNTKRFRCKDGCESAKSTKKQDAIDLSDSSGTEVEEIEEIEIAYKGKEVYVTSTQPQVLTTCILGESINSDFCTTLVHYCNRTKSSLHVFFKKRYVKDQHDIGRTLEKLSEYLDGIDYYFHVSEDLIVNHEIEVRASANVHHNQVTSIRGQSIGKNKVSSYSTCSSRNRNYRRRV